MIPLSLVLIFICSSLTIAGLCPSYSQNDSGTAVRELIFNECPPSPRRYRATTDDPSAHFELYRNQIGEIGEQDLTNYAATKMSGSGQFCEKHLSWFKDVWGENAIVVDLRMESHGFLDGQAVSWFCPKNWDRLRLGTEQLMKSELEEFQKLRDSGNQMVYDKPHGSEVIKDGRPVNFTAVITEPALLSAAGIDYIRLFMPDHRRPRDGEIQQFVNLHVSNPRRWIHFHCKAGKGRTTTAMIMRDMLINHELPVLTLIKRNNIFGRVDLLDFDRLKGSYKEPFARERAEFLYVFYGYCQRRAKNEISWLGYLYEQTDALGKKIIQSIGFLTPLTGSEEIEVKQRRALIKTNIG